MSAVEVIELVPSVCVCGGCVCETYVVHHFVGTGLPSTCIVRQRFLEDIQFLVAYVLMSIYHGKWTFGQKDLGLQGTGGVSTLGCFHS